MIYNKELIGEMYAANFFGSSEDYTELDLDLNMQSWIIQMENIGWNIGREFDDDVEFSDACDVAISQLC